MRVGYIRVSSTDQNESRQLEALKKYEIEKMFSEKISGKDTNRPQLQAMMDFVREGDCVYVLDFSRLARNTKDLLDITEKLQAKGVHFVSLKESIDTTTPAGKLMLTVIAAIAEFERAIILERQREGISIAKRNGVYKGRKPISADTDKFKKLYQQYNSREINKVEFAKRLGISRPTLDRLIQEYQVKV